MGLAVVFLLKALLHFVLLYLAWCGVQDAAGWGQMPFWHYASLYGLSVVVTSVLWIAEHIARGGEKDPMLE